MDMVMQSMLYDQKYGVYEKIEDMNEEHLAYVEDLLLSKDEYKMWRAIAKLE